MPSMDVVAIHALRQTKAHPTHVCTETYHCLDALLIVADLPVVHAKDIIQDYQTD